MSSVPLLALTVGLSIAVLSTGSEIQPDPGTGASAAPCRNGAELAHPEQTKSDLQLSVKATIPSLCACSLPRAGGDGWVPFIYLSLAAARAELKNLLI